MKWTKDTLLTAIQNAECISDVCRLLGITSTAANYRTFHKYCLRYGLDTSHFVRVTQRHKQANINKRKCSFEDIFCENSTYAQAPLRKRIIKDGMIPYKCSCCGNTGEWLKKPISLQLDHINGVNNDHRVDNLRWLCPNCHSQTVTYTGKNKKP